VVLFFVLALDSLLRGHDLATSRRAIKALIKIISQYKLDSYNFYDLGCGRGTLVLAVKRELPHLTVYGIDNSAIRIFFAKIKSKFSGQKINLKKQDIFQIDLRNADIIYAYLWYDLMPLLEKKLRKELKQGAIVITNTSNFPTWKPIKTYVTYPKKSDFEKLFVYQLY
jgi:ubiquinone/menaquinone biosynthesis C-methylase UbiE